MKNTWKTACALCSAVCLLVVTQALGQVTQPRNPAQKEALGRADAGQQKICLASKVTKMMVKDSANGAIGQIQDLVIDETGQVQYLAISAQDAAATDRLQPRSTPGARANEQPGAQPAGRTEAPARNLTAKLTLVPFDAVQFHEGETEAQNYVSLSIDKDRFSQAPSFTVQQLTAQGQQATWMAQVDQFFGREKSGAARPDLNNRNRNDETRGTKNRNESDLPKPDRNE
jgi:hypothetical protein